MYGKDSIYGDFSTLQKTRWQNHFSNKTRLKLKKKKWSLQSCAAIRGRKWHQHFLLAQKLKEEIHFEIGVNIGKKYIFLHTRMRNDPIFKEIYPTLEKRYLFWTPPLSIFTSARVCSASHNQVHIKYLRFGPGRDEEFLPGRDDTPSCTFVSARAETKIFPGRVDTAGPRRRYT